MNTATSAPNPVSTDIINLLPSDDAGRQAIPRLVAEFAGILPAWQVHAAVREAHHDLAGSPISALPELVERLARVRLREALDAPAVTR